MIRALRIRRLTGEPEFWSAVGCIIWAKWVFFEPMRLDTQANYAALSGVVSPAMLGSVAFGIGLTQAAMVWLDMRWGRFAVAMAAGAFWFVLGHGLWLSDRSAPGASVYFTLGLVDVAAVLRIRHRRA